jgi:hypothetical protein
VVAQNPHNVANFKAQLGNTSLQRTFGLHAGRPGYGDLQAKIAAANAAANNTQNESGIQQLLGGVEGPTTAGINKLDSLLLSADPTNYKTIQDAGAGAANLLPTLNQTTTDQNALAATGATNASTSAAAAAKALQDALSSETGNLSNQQKSIEDIVNQYNKSVGIINPVTQTIAQDIQNFLSANPQLSISDAKSILGPLMNLQNIQMPDQSTYASKGDYATIKALEQLGIDPSALGGLSINSGQSDLAQTFKLPEQLQNAIGQAPGVTKSLSDALNGVGGQINAAVKPFTDAQDAYGKGADLVHQLDAQIAPLKQQVRDLQGQLQRSGGGKAAADLQAQLDAASTQLNQLQNQRSIQDSMNTHSWDTLTALAPGLQWVNQAAPGYNDLITAINSELGKLGAVGAPTLNYGPDTVSNPLTNVDTSGQALQKQVSNAAAIGTGAGTTAAAAVPSLAAPGIASSITAGGSPAALDALGLSPVEAAGPAALAAYGTANVIQNSLKNPIQSGIMTLANTGLSLATLSLPPQVFQSIGSAITSVFNSIGDFFGGLF